MLAVIDLVYMLHDIMTQLANNFFYILNFKLESQRTDAPFALKCRMLMRS